MSDGLDATAQRALIEKHTPALVLFPEIPAGSRRVRNPDYPDDSPILNDYHPRDIRIVLENAGLHWRFSWREPFPRPTRRFGDSRVMLDRMERRGYDRHIDVMPDIRPDEKERFWEAYGNIPAKDEKYPRMCYARYVPGRGRNADKALVQYWYAYLYNDFWNTHEMDWETVMVQFDVTPEGLTPERCAYSAHMGGHWLPMSEVERTTEQLAAPVRGAAGGGNATHPVVYVASGSHANYFSGPETFRTAHPAVDMLLSLRREHRRLIDYTTSWDEGHREIVRAERIPEPAAWTGDWRWLNQQRRWGSNGDFDLEFGDSGPMGPPQGGMRWDRPLMWVRSCDRAE